MRGAEVNKFVEFIAPCKHITKNGHFRSCLSLALQIPLDLGSFLLTAMTGMVLARAAFLLFINPCQAASVQKPHIVLIVADDLVKTYLNMEILEV